MCHTGRGNQDKLGFDEGLALVMETTSHSNFCPLISGADLVDFFQKVLLIYTHCGRSYGHIVQWIDVSLLQHEFTEYDD